MKSKATLKTIERAMKKAKINIKRAKARGDEMMLIHHRNRLLALEK